MSRSMLDLDGAPPAMVNADALAARGSRLYELSRAIATKKGQSSATRGYGQADSNTRLPQASLRPTTRIFTQIVGEQLSRPSPPRLKLFERAFLPAQRESSPPRGQQGICPRHLSSLVAPRHRYQILQSSQTNCKAATRLATKF